MDNFGRYGASPFPVSPTAAAERVTAFLRKVYGWMCAGLVVTALVALQVAGSPAVMGYLVSNQFLFMGLIGLVLASLVGVFWHNDALQFAISVVGVIVFTGLAAWDAQRMKQMALAVPEGQAGSYAIVGALALYLDFINLFLFLLRFFGSRRD